MSTVGECGSADPTTDVGIGVGRMRPAEPPSMSTPAGARAKCPAGVNRGQGLPRVNGHGERYGVGA